MKLLDLFCGGGGASLGYEQSGFDVVGVDVNMQQKYRGDFVQADAFDYFSKHWREFDVIHASPPCQQYSLASMQFRQSGKVYPDLIGQIRELLKLTGKPFVIENVPGAPLENPITLCGQMFNIRTYRHRLFESNIPLIAPQHEMHKMKNAKMGRNPKHDEYIQYVGHFSGVKQVQNMTGLYWLGQSELAQSIPPQYTKYIGQQLISYLENKA